MTQVSVVGLRKSYGGSPAIHDVSLQAESGELITLLGPSGCGKTTTLRCIAGFMAPDGGDIRVDGSSILAMPPARRDFGVVFQNYALFPHLSVFENVAYGLRVRRVARDEEKRRVADALAVVQLQGLEQRLPRALSGGQQQRVALARALVIRPRLLLLDEPLANLDARLRQEVRGLIRSVQTAEAITAFYVTHDQSEAMAMSDRIAVMQAGRVAQFAAPREIYQRPVSRYVAEFTGDANFLSARILEAISSSYRISLAGAVLTAAGPPGLAAGARALLMLRPEAISLAASGEAGLTGRIISAAFLGNAQHCEICCADGSKLRLLAPANAALPPGGEVHLAVDAAQAWLMPEAA